jgi:hypothetical protein
MLRRYKRSQNAPNTETGDRRDSPRQHRGNRDGKIEYHPRSLRLGMIPYQGVRASDAFCSAA